MIIRFLIHSAVTLLIGVAASGSARAQGQCAALMNTVCLGCHTRDRFCERLGSTEKQWQSLIKWMITNGADLDEEQVKLLAGCLSGPTEEAMKVCGK
jgi:hypothetical protein